ncbi:hypothetical protein D3C81_170360 [compost metagenome]
MHWTTALALATAPTVVWLLSPLIKKIRDYDNRRLMEEEDRVAKRKAEKEAAKGPRYTSATVVPPARLPHLRSDDGSGSDSAGPSERS